MRKNKVGILASISWNSNDWQDPATTEDIEHSNFEYVKKNEWMHEDLNFAIEKYPKESDGTFIAYTPLFNRLPSLEESKYVDIVFFRSLNYHTKQNCIVGFYAFPEIDRFDREADHVLYNQYDFGNVKSKPQDIVYFSNPVIISDEIVLKYNYLPPGKKLGKMGYNYLFYENVIKILDKATDLNPENNKLKKVKFRFLTEAKYKSLT